MLRAVINTMVTRKMSTRIVEASVLVMGKPPRFAMSSGPSEAIKRSNCTQAQNLSQGIYGLTILVEDSNNVNNNNWEFFLEI